MLYNQPFLGSILITLKKETSTLIPTACVGLNGINFMLTINPDYWQTLNEDQKVGLLKHETGHITNFHLTEYSHLKDHETANIAMDIYINQTIPANELPPNGCEWHKYKNLVANMDTNWYYEQLLKNYNSGSCENTTNSINDLKQGKGSSSLTNGEKVNLPSHKWEEITENSDAMKKIISNTIIDQLENIIKNLKAGDYPGNLQELLTKLKRIEPPKFNWKRFVRNFVTVSTKTDIKKTNRKRSKRFVGLQGNTEKRYSHILVALDTSASFTTPELIESQNELHHLHKIGHDITVVLADTQITKQFKFNPKKDIEVTGRGGTSFQEVIDLFVANRHKYSCLIYFTDGEASVPIGARGNILWVHSSKSNINTKLQGKKIKLP